MRYVKNYFQSYKIPIKNDSQILSQHLRYVGKMQRYIKRIIFIKLTAEFMNYYRQRGINYLLKRSEQQIPKPETSFEQNQLLLGLCAQITMLLSVMTATCLRATRDASPEAIELADQFCMHSQEQITILRIKITNHHLKTRERINQLGAKIMNGDYQDILEQNIVCENLPNMRSQKDL